MTGGLLLLLLLLLPEHTSLYTLCSVAAWPSRFKFKQDDVKYASATK
jgi:hypothetical protein